MIQPGTVVQIKAHKDGYWEDLSGKTATVLSSENGFLTLDIDGLPYPDVSLDRVEIMDPETAPLMVDTRPTVSHMVVLMREKFLAGTLTIEDFDETIGVLADRE